MQQSSESTSSTDELTQQKLNNFKERATDLLTKMDTSEEELIKFSSELRLQPLIGIEVKEELLSKNSFEMFEKTKLNPVFLLNLLNIITVVNFVWNATKKNILKFHRILLELKIMFSYIQNSDEIEYALLSTIPLQIYELVASKGKNCFKDHNYEFNKDFLSSDRNKAQIGLVYQENAIIQLNTMLNGKELETPTIMYYLHHKECKKLFKSSVFNRPENFLNLKYTLKPGFHGYDEIDHSFILKEDAELSQNCIFNKVMENNILIKEFNPNSQDKIKLPKDTNIFVEMKTYLVSQSEINKLIKTSKEFENAYKNLAFDGIERKFWKNKSQYYLFYNNQRKDAIPTLKYLEDKEVIKNTKVLYNSGYVQIASIASLQNQIRTMNIKLDKIEEEKEQMKKKLNQQNDAIDLLYKKMQIQKEILKFTYANPVNLDSFKEILKNLNPVSNNALMKFSSVYSSYERLCSRVLDKDDKLITSAKKVIGKALVLEDEKKEFFNLLSLLDKKISENIFVSCYYEAFKDVLTGTKWKSSFTSKDFKVLDVFSNYKKKDVFVTILKFIVVFEQDQDLEYNFI